MYGGCDGVWVMGYISGFGWGKYTGVQMGV